MKIPGGPIAYWIGDNLMRAFEVGTPLMHMCTTRKGMATGLNAEFVRRWHEVPHGQIGFGLTRPEAELSGLKWFPYANGGAYRKWWGNYDDVVNWQFDGSRLQTEEHESGRIRAVNLNLDYIFQQGLSWTSITSGSFSIRELPSGFLFSSASNALFCNRDDDLEMLLGLLNSKIYPSLSGLINPTLNANPGDIGKIPALHGERFDKPYVPRLCSVSRNDWNSYEYSWGFSRSPLLSNASDSKPETLLDAYTTWIANNTSIITEAKCLEEKNNRLFIDVYGLQDELTPEVPIEQITLTVNPSYRYGGGLSKEERWERFRRDTMAELLSYAAGCMMGRFSLDQPGLILADSRASQVEQLAAYETKVGKPLSKVQFKPDPDGIIPVLDGEWFEDDIVARTREFLAVTFPESSVGENLRFIEDSLGKDIRKYFCTEFYKDHLQTYKKRPIYWLVQSPKKGFACLIYLHRYTKDTLNQVLNNYFRPYLQKLEARLAQLGLDQLNDSLPTRERTAARKEAEKITKVLKECEAWEQDALLPLAQQRIELDLDDGVKVNYLKLQDVLATIPGLAAKED